MNKMWRSLINFFLKTKKEENLPDTTGKTINVLQSNNIETKPEKLTHVAIVLQTIRKYYYDRGRFTSDELYFFIVLNDYNLSKKQFWRVLSRLSKFNYINKIIMDSNTVNSYYILTEKFYTSKTIKLY
jgi:hypothetical protein